MEEPTKIIREAARKAMETFADFIQEEAGLAMSATYKRVLAESLDHNFHAWCKDGVELIFYKYLDYPTVVQLSENDAKTFTDAFNRPLEPNAKLQKLTQTKAPWED